MKLDVLDKSNYFKGLLLLIRKDYKIADEEKILMLKVGETLGFEKRFCEASINDILNNDYIIDEPPTFSNSKIAESFILDGLNIAYADRDLDENEVNWLKQTAEINGISDYWFSDQLVNNQSKQSHDLSSTSFEVTNYL